MKPIAGLIASMLLLNSAFWMAAFFMAAYISPTKTYQIDINHYGEAWWELGFIIITLLSGILLWMDSLKGVIWRKIEWRMNGAWKRESSP